MWHFLVSTNEVICHMGSRHPPKEDEGDDLIGNNFFLVCLWLPYLAFKNLSLSVTLWSSLLVARGDAAWSMNQSIKPIRSLKCTWLNFCYLTGPLKSLENVLQIYVSLLLTCCLRADPWGSSSPNFGVAHTWVHQLFVRVIETSGRETLGSLHIWGKVLSVKMWKPMGNLRAMTGLSGQAKNISCV